MRIRWTIPAADDLESIKDYLIRHYPHFAEPTVRAIYQRILALKASPYHGRPGHRTGTRELALSPLPYVVVYRVKSEAVEVLSGVTTFTTGCLIVADQRGEARALFLVASVRPAPPGGL